MTRRGGDQRARTIAERSNACATRRDQGPRIEDFDNWQVAGVNQGPLYTAQNSNDVVISTGAYQDLPYTWEIRTSTLDESNTVLNQLQLQDAGSIG